MAPRSPARPARPKTTSVFVALLRGINVGGKNMLPMADLAGFFTDAGCAEVRTYIQSGNVVFASSPAAAKRVPQAISKRISDRFGHRVPVVLRAADELARAVDLNPFPKADPALLGIGFLADVPDASRIAALNPERSPGDSFAIRGPDIYLHLPTGFAGTKLTNAYFDSALATTSTFRNWRTVLKLIELTRALA